MLFDQFLRRFSFFIADKNVKPKRLLLNPSKDESARLNLEKANKLIAELAMLQNPKDTKKPGDPCC